MIYFFGQPDKIIFAVETPNPFSDVDIKKLSWLFSGVSLIESSIVEGDFIGPRLEMITPWSTNAVEITRNMGIAQVIRIECFTPFSPEAPLDIMLHQRVKYLDQNIFQADIKPKAIENITDIAAYNRQEGLSLTSEEISYLEKLSEKINRPLTDSEIFGFSQVNSEHCRHKIFNGRFIIDGQTMPESLFELIKKTSKKHADNIVSAYTDNVAFIKGPIAEQFAPKSPDKADFYTKTDFQSIISLKAETHNFPTTVEPFNGAATGSGGEIRDRMAGGRGSVPLAGSAVYMTSYPRLNAQRDWEKSVEPREWLYQSPLDILIKASNGASDFGNKFGQPLILGSLMTFEHLENNQVLGYDKAIMLAGGVGYGKLEYSQKNAPKSSDRILLMGGDNYRIGMGGAAVSSSDTGAFNNTIEINAVQRSNPEMQKRVSNVIRALVESEENPIVSVHDHGAGGHLNCFSELVEDHGGKINIDELPLGDTTLSMKEIIGNESQERMGLVVSPKDKDTLKRIAKREQSPIYDVGVITGDERFVIASNKTAEKPLDLNIHDLFGNPPKVVLEDYHQKKLYKPITYRQDNVYDYLEKVLSLESVACKDWLTNKVDRCVGGKVAKQQCVGPLQLPLNNFGLMAIDYAGKHGIATSIGHSPLSALIDASAGSKNAIAKALTNIVWAPIEGGISGISLSANWMWPCKNKGEDARLYEAVKSCSDFAIDLGINIPTGKDSLSMTQKYSDLEVKSPGTVIISATAHSNDITNTIEPVLQKNGQDIYYLNLSKCTFSLGGSAFSQVISRLGQDTATVEDASYFRKSFNAVQNAIKGGKISAGHDVSSGGLITTLLEMCFADTDLGMDVDLSSLRERDCTKLLFSENIALIIQADSSFETEMVSVGIELTKIGKVTNKGTLNIKNYQNQYQFDIDKYRDIWYKTSYLLDQHQSGKQKALERFSNYKNQPLKYQFPKHFSGKIPQILIKNRPQAAIIREKGSNSEREMANAMYKAGFDVKDVHMTDLVSGKETLKDIRFLGAVGGFSNSDVLGSAKGWAGAFIYNKNAHRVINQFFEREDTLSVGICNGCQLFLELDLIKGGALRPPKMLHNESQKFECTFTSVNIQPNRSVMMSSLSGMTLGIWSAHGEGRFSMPESEDKYQIVGKFGYDNYPACPNGSDYATAMLSSKDGRHLVSMPHFERSLYPWNWAHYPKRKDEISPWIEAFENAYKWITKY